MPEQASMREAYGKTLLELGRVNPDIVVLDADLCASTMTKYFMTEFPLGNSHYCFLITFTKSFPAW